LSQLLCQAQTVDHSALFYIGAASPEARAVHESAMRQGITQSNSLIDALAEVCQTPDERQCVSEFRAAWNAYSATLIEQLLPADSDQAQSLMRDGGATNAAAQEAFSRLDALEQATRTAATAALASIDDQRSLAESVMLGLMLAAAAISVLIALQTTSRLTSAVNSVRNAARLVAEGDLEWSVSLDTNDEIQDIAESLTKVSRRTRQSLATSEETTEQLQRQIGECRALQGLLTVEGNRLDTVIGLLEQAIILSDDAGRITLLSQEAADLTGWRREQALGEPIDEVLQLLNEATGKKRPSPGAQAVQSRRTVRHGKRATLLDKTGQQRRIVVHSAPVLDSDRQFAGTVIVFHEEAPRA
jgi:PAS domain S-box-containing protein